MESSKLIQEKISNIIDELMRYTEFYDIDLLKEIKDMQRIRNRFNKMMKIKKEDIRELIVELMRLTDIFDMDLLKEIKDMQRILYGPKKEIK